MGFIYGLIKTAGSFNNSDFKKLEQAMLNDGFTTTSIIEESFAFGICWNPERKPNVYIYSDSNYAIAADIRLYNTEKLRKQFDFETPADAFIKAYAQWGEECANHLNGDYTVVLIDKQKNKVLLFRDHIGCRPLAYYTNENQLILASHEFGIAKSGLAKVELCKETAFDRIFAIKGSYKRTVFKNIYKLTPGHWGLLSTKRIIEHKYWKPEKIGTNKTLTFDESVKRIREKLIAATTNRMEVGEIGVHVSGGLDSTGIACILADYIDDKKRLTGYSWTPSYKTSIVEEVKHLNETPFINDFINDKCIDVRFLDKKCIEGFLKDSTQFDFEVQHIEHPTMRQASKDNISVLFSGWGGDEFVTLSNRGVMSHLFFKLSWLKLLQYIKKTSIRSSILTFRREILPLFIPFGLLHVYQPFPLKNTRYIKCSLKNRLQIFYLFLSSKSFFSIRGRKGLSINLLKTYHLPQRMDAWAINAEKYGFEYRYALLDKDLLELWFSIPPEHTFYNFKSRILFREALRDILTESVRIRTDKGELLRISDSLNKSKEVSELITREIKNYDNGSLNDIFNHAAIVKKAKESQLCNENIYNQIKTKKVLLNYLRYQKLHQEYFLNTKKAESESDIFQ